VRLVAIGDSISFGRGFCGYCVPFVNLFAAAITRDTGLRVKVSNMSDDTAINSTDLLRALSSATHLRAAVAKADAITLTIGHNDPPWNRSDDVCDGRAAYPNVDWAKYDAACLRATAAVYSRNLGAILRRIVALRRRKATLVRVTNDYDDLIGDSQFPKSATPVAKRFFDAYSALTCRLARKYGAVCVDTYHAFNGPNGTRDAGPVLALDHTHPNAAGHLRIARLLRQAGYRPLG
jgi:lysophospholipase L1-like esterase